MISDVIDDVLRIVVDTVWINHNNAQLLNNDSNLKNLN